MQNHLLTIATQYILGVGLLTMLMFLVIPMIKSSYQGSLPTYASYVLEFNDSKLSIHKMLMNRIRKLITQHQGAVKIEVVATGKGVCLYEDGNSFDRDIRILLAQGVIFTACQQSVQALERLLGHPIALIPGVHIIADGHSYAEKLKNAGYIDELA